VVQLLLNKGADVEAKDKDGWTALIWAAQGGYEAMVRLLLDKRADVEAKDQYGWTALLWAAQEGHEAVVRLLALTPSS
jgi:ankyrin repeat protein